MGNKLNLVLKIVLTICLLLLATGRVFIVSQTGFMRYGLIQEEIGAFLLAVFPAAMWLVWHLINKADSHMRKNFAFAAYFAAAAAYMLFTAEILFRYAFSAQRIDFQSDLTSGLYMIAMSAAALYLSAKNDGESGKSNIYIGIGIAALIALWLIAQDRIEWIIRSVMQNSLNDVDSEEFYLNWFAHRKQMLGVSLFGTSAQISSMKLYMFFENKCPLVWLRSNFGWYGTIATLVTVAVLLCVMVLMCRNYKCTKYKSLMQIICVSTLVQAVVGVAANLFMMYGSHVGIPGLHSIFTLLPIVGMLHIPLEKS